MMTGRCNQQSIGNGRSGFTVIFVTTVQYSTEVLKKKLVPFTTGIADDAYID